MKPNGKLCSCTTSKYLLMSGPKHYAIDAIAIFINRQNNKACGRLFVQLMAEPELETISDAAEMITEM